MIMMHNVRLSRYTALLLALFTIISASGDQCGGEAPMESIVNFLGATLDYDVADHICCNNNRYAERKGYLEEPEVALFSRLNRDKETVFYDSVCGIPLFIAPRGRSFEDFEKESIYHGWPSFRPEEIISENVKIHFGGRMESKCNTHLGHNLPNGGVDRYCIDLVCIAGTESESSEFNHTDYTSSAEQWSGKHPGRVKKIIVWSIVGFVLLVATIGFLGWRFRRAWRNITDGTDTDTKEGSRLKDNNSDALSNNDSEDSSEDMGPLQVTGPLV